MSAQKPLHTLLMGATLAGVLSTLPVHFQFAGPGLLPLKPSVAFAKDGRDDERDDDHEDDRDDSHDDRGDDRGRDDDSARGRGGDDGRDDRSGRQGGGEDDDGRGWGSGGDDRSDDRGWGSGGDDRGRNDDGGLEVRLRDGGRVEIENGRFERKDANGRTIEERRATAADIERYSSAKLRPRSTRGGGGVVAKAERADNNLEVVYTDGWKEEIDSGRYELKDNLDRTVVERRATQADFRRLSVAFR